MAKSGKKSAALGCSMGCLITLLICGVAAFFVFKTIKSKLDNAVVNFTADQPVEIQSPDTSRDVVLDAVSRYDAFVASLSAGQTPEPLELTADDINALLFYHPKFQDVAGKGKVDIQNDRIISTVSFSLDDLNIPVKFIADSIAGRYFNGEATLAVGMTSGIPSLQVEALTVNGQQFPAEFMTALSQENLLKDLQTDPEMQAVFDKLTDIRVEDNKLKITPSGSTSSAPASQPAETALP